MLKLKTGLQDEHQMLVGLAIVENLQHDKQLI